MKILTVTNMYPSVASPWFGCFVQEQVEDLRDLGFEVDVIAFDARVSRLEYAKAAIDVRRASRGGYDLIHAHYGLTGAVALTQRRLPVVTTFCGSDGYIGWQLKVSRVVAQRSTPIAVTSELASRLRRVDATIIPAGVDLTRFRPRDRADARARLGWDIEATYVVFPGARANTLKRYDLFCAATQIARRSLTNLQTVTLEGLTRDAVALVFAAADVTVLTSDWEGSPVTVKESLASGTPVVAVDAGDVAEVIAGLAACELCPRDSNALAAALVTAARSSRGSDLRQRATLYGRKRAAERLAEVFTRAIAGA
jgi:glycosyltransferase involved in cell wall biosynthesis